MSSPRRVVSISLGTSKRDKSAHAEFLGIPFHIERRGTDGSRARFRELVASLDGQVDCFGIGGTDAYLYAGSRRYPFRQTLRLMEPARITPWVDGSGLKNTLERETIAWLQQQGVVDFGRSRVLLMSAVDRFGMAEAVAHFCPHVVYGDLLFGLGIPIPIRRWSMVKRLARLALPIITRLPVEWIYPTGQKQEQNTPRYMRYFESADVIAGDWHLIRRFMPHNLRGKTIITQSSRESEVQLLRERGVRRLITTTPQIGGDAFATNVMEAVLVVLLARHPADLSPDDYLRKLAELNWSPNVQELNP